LAVANRVASFAAVVGLIIGEMPTREHMSKLQELRAQHEAAGAAMIRLRNVIRAENRDFNPEERAEWEKANKDFDALDAKIAIEERCEGVEAVLGRSNGEGAKVKPGAQDAVGKRNAKGGKNRSAEQIERLHTLAFDGWFRRQLEMPVSEESQRAAKSLGIRLGARSLDIVLPRRPGEVESRAQSVGTNSEGGYLRPTGMVTNLERALKEYDSVRQVAEVIRTSDGGTLNWPTVNDTSNTGVLIAEGTQVSEGAIAFGNAQFSSYKFSSNLVLVNFELDEDSAFDMTSTVGSLLGERLGRVSNTYTTTGTGSSQPAGIVTGSTLGKTAAGAAAITADEIIDLFHSVDPAYRDRPGAGFMMHDNIAAAVRKLKDSENRYLWDLDTLRNGMPPVLLGKRVKINQSMQSSIATATKTIIFGDLASFKIRDVGRVRIKRLVERYADYDQIGFVAFIRFDSKVLNAGTNPIKHLIQA